MNIIIADIDPLIIKLLDLPELVKMMTINKNINKIIIDQPIIKQYRILNDTNLTIFGKFRTPHEKTFIDYIKDLFIKQDNNNNIDMNNELLLMVCTKGYIDMAQWLIRLWEGDGDSIDIHYGGEAAFAYSCRNGHIDVAKWLVNLGEKQKYDKINIHAGNGVPFAWSCENGHIDVAKWLIELGEHKAYGKINIHGLNEGAFNWCCGNGHIGVAKWLVYLGEYGGYGKIDIPACNNYAYKWADFNKHTEVVRWLNELEISGYETQ